MAIQDIVSGLGAQIGTAANGLGVGFGKGGLSISANFNQRLQQKLTKTEQDSPLKALYRDSEELTADIIFPQDLDTEHYIMFRAKERNRNKKNKPGTTKTLQSIVLPVPTNLSSNYGVAYGEQAMGFAGGLAAGTLGLGNAASGISGSLSDFGKALSGEEKAGSVNATSSKQILAGVGTTAVVGGLAAAVGGPLAGIAAAAIGGAEQVARGSASAINKALNSQMAVLFDGVGFRSFDFNYRFVARNAKESDTLRKMIYQFKKYMYPDYAYDGLAFEYPEEWEIEFSEKISPWIYKAKRCVLESFNVNYAGENGIPKFYEETGAPVIVDIQMKYKEIEIITKKDIKESGGV
jgi:hypothetical protein